MLPLLQVGVHERYSARVGAGKIESPAKSQEQAGVEMTDEQPKEKSFSRCIIKEAKGAYIGLVTWIIIFVAALVIASSLFALLRVLTEYLVNNGSGIRDAANAILNGIGSAILSVIPIEAIFVLILILIPAVYALLKCLCRWYRGFIAWGIISNLIGAFLIALFGAFLNNYWLLISGFGMMVLAIGIAFAADSVQDQKKEAESNDGNWH